MYEPENALVLMGSANFVISYLVLIRDILSSILSLRQIKLKTYNNQLSKYQLNQMKGTDL